MNFIDSLSKYAINHGRANGVLPSLIIAQGVLESASGSSELALNANNLFGIKKGAGWTGEVYSKKTGEYDSTGKYFEIIANFRKYPSIEGAVIDLCDKYVNGLSWEKHNRYAALIDEKDYKRAAQAVYAAGYATDPEYPSKLIGVIEKYNLTKFDKEVINVEEKEIVIDPGHGGIDPGGGSNIHFKEKDLVLKISLEQKKHFERNGIKVHMTRTTDEYLDSVPRTDRVKNSGAAFCISNHINAGGGEGAETIHSIYSNNALAASVLKTLVAVGAKYRRSFSRRGTKGDYYYMHRMTGSVNTVIVEYGFADNNNDTEKLLKDWKSYAEVVAKYYIENVFKQKYIEEKKEVNEVGEQKLTAAQEAVRLEAIALGITDGKNPFRPVNQYYVWNALLSIAKELAELKKNIK